MSSIKYFTINNKIITSLCQEQQDSMRFKNLMQIYGVVKIPNMGYFGHNDSPLLCLRRILTHGYSYYFDENTIKQTIEFANKQLGIQNKTTNI